MKPNNLVFAILVIILQVNIGTGQDLANIPAMFLDIGYGARPMGMGGAFTALANDANAALWNPAGLATLPGPSLSFFYTRQLNLIPYMLAAYASKPETKRFAHSEVVIVSGDDALRETSLLVAAAYDLSQKLHVGGTLNYRNANFGDNSNGGPGRVTGSAVGLGLDLGLLYAVQKQVNIGVTAKNFLNVVAWNTTASGSYNQGSPLRLVLGLAIQPGSKYALALDWEKSLHSDTSDRFHLGLERQFYQIVTLRAGAFQSLAATSDINYSLGIGFQYESESLVQFYLDLAYLLQDLENSFKISLTAGFY